MFKVNLINGLMDLRPYQGRNGIAKVTNLQGDSHSQCEMTPHQLRRLATAADALADELESEQ